METGIKMSIKAEAEKNSAEKRNFDFLRKKEVFFFA